MSRHSRENDPIKHSNLNHAIEQLNPSLEQKYEPLSPATSKNIIEHARAEHAKQDTFDSKQPESVEAYDQSLKAVASVGYRLGYVERLLSIDTSLIKKGLGPTLSTEQKKRLTTEASSLNKDFEAVTQSLPESVSFDLNKAGYNARNAGHSCAAIDVDEIREGKYKSDGILTKDEELYYKNNATMMLEWALQNNLRK